MARKSPHELELDGEMGEETTEIIIDKYMEDISEILARAYTEVEIKVRALVEDLSEDE